MYIIENLEGAASDKFLIDNSLDVVKTLNPSEKPDNSLLLFVKVLQESSLKFIFGL